MDSLALQAVRWFEEHYPGEELPVWVKVARNVAPYNSVATWALGWYVARHPDQPLPRWGRELVATLSGVPAARPDDAGERR